MRASRERGTARWWDLFIVIPVLQLSSSLARSLINHSSTTTVSRSLSAPISARNPSRAISRPPMAHEAKRTSERTSERTRERENAFAYILVFERSGARVLHRMPGELMKTKQVQCRKPRFGGALTSANISKQMEDEIR